MPLNLQLDIRLFKSKSERREIQAFLCVPRRPLDSSLNIYSIDDLQSLSRWLWLSKGLCATLEEEFEKNFMRLLHLSLRWSNDAPIFSTTTDKFQAITSSSILNGILQSWNQYSIHVKAASVPYYYLYARLKYIRTAAHHLLSRRPRDRGELTETELEAPSSKSGDRELLLRWEFFSENSFKDKCNRKDLRQENQAAPWSSYP